MKSVWTTTAPHLHPLHGSPVHTEPTVLQMGAHRVLGAILPHLSPPYTHDSYLLLPSAAPSMLQLISQEPLPPGTSRLGWAR